MDNKIIEIINKWNPIKIYPLLQDEYHFESKHIMKAAVNSESVEILAKEIFNIFNQCFGKEFTTSLEECEVIAEEILRYKIE
ncbi:YugE family protein [Paenibacillus sp. ACRRX]|uniref:DUF1871 family protein n=1 Tax=Paenibacillus sp. ACRRX TaxID=2918206 RepID=UPI001EF53165|nr:DUF1871 family protein [Paenibacillus sp. ACRRX]MCG7410893.1 YugE family protein [Paenibacillus sp. ACRRX]